MLFGVTNPGSFLVLGFFAIFICQLLLPTHRRSHSPHTVEIQKLFAEV
jgi:hypothetical protein